jgi:hypothetical protein
MLFNNLRESFHSPNYPVFSRLLPSLFSSFLTENLTEFLKKTLNFPRETKQVSTDCRINNLEKKRLKSPQRELRWTAVMPCICPIYLEWIQQGNLMNPTGHLEYCSTGLFCSLQCLREAVEKTESDTREF